MTLKLCDFRGDWALVTGASSGLGKEFARQLGAMGMNVVLTARRGELLEETALDIEQVHGVQTKALVEDLSDPGAPARIKKTLSDEGINIRLLCNNAGMGRWGRFEDGAGEDYQRMIQVNVTAPILLCRLFLEDLARHASSLIINVSSGAAYQPVPYMAAYAASKASLHQFSQALYGEWLSRGVLVKTFVPGPADTEFDEKAGAYESAIQDRASAVAMVQAALAGLGDDKPLIVAAKGTWMQRLFAGIFPSAMVIRQVGKMFRPPA
ncbi:SDR family NAD(P)-dependent oxidoreductase [Ectothiorhodospira shaposhnikovii]|uniref:SDR family NAD(P)-dependent oxidoreductase n=1 Tax=Ectothiorhodospira shaposhnikovii TaxID=1054 RepID=UPI001EE7E4EE|nr:SDR family NAD(P)-dependent oxidoreductase [Ectothiorhodospira shaposhnikovii]MCG5512182.1 SDR family NAD(P)-dependent oxidoreductase [Ectothiorhodospira shaposhnikovii]